MQNITASIHGSTTYSDGTHDTFWNQTVEIKDVPLWWQLKGLSFTATGYGKRIPTRHMIKFNNKWRRVYVCTYSNNAIAYIGKLSAVGENITVQFND